MIQDLDRALLRRDGGTQARVAIPDAVVANYAAAYEAADPPPPPLIAFHDGHSYWLADGFIRDLALASLGCDTARVDVRQGTLWDARLYAAQANHAHGLPRTNADKRQAVLMVLSVPDYWTKSDREVAKAARVCDHAMPARVRHKVITNELSLPDVPEDSVVRILQHSAAGSPRTGSDGRLFKPKKGKRADPDDDDEDDEPEEPEQDTPPPEPPQLVDGLGEPVPDGLRDVFLSRWKFERAAEAFRAAAQLSREAAESPGGRDLMPEMGTIGTAAEQLASVVEWAAPHAVAGDGWGRRGRAS